MTPMSLSFHWFEGNCMWKKTPCNWLELQRLHLSEVAQFCSHGLLSVAADCITFSQLLICDVTDMYTCTRTESYPVKQICYETVTSTTSGLLHSAGLGLHASFDRASSKTCFNAAANKIIIYVNNNACQIYFYLTPNLLVWIEIINIHKQVTHIMHYLSGVKYLYVCHTAASGSFKAPSQPGVRPVRPSTGIWLQALREVEKPFFFFKEFHNSSWKLNISSAQTRP